MARQPRILAGQTAAITGGARGIGRATALALLRQGMRVAIGDVDIVAAQQTSSELGASTVALPVDVTAQRILDINVHGVINGLKTALPGMIERQRGHVINIASQAGKYGFPGGATYCASKAAVINLSRAVRKELRGSGVEISIVSPVVVNTELGLGLSQPRLRQFRKVEPEDVAQAIVKTLQLPTFDVHVPKQMRISERLSGLLPVNAQDSLSRVSGGDAVLSQVDMGARSDYELRAARSEPGLAPGPDAAQITQGAGEDLAGR